MDDRRSMVDECDSKLLLGRRAWLRRVAAYAALPILDGALSVGARLETGQPDTGTRLLRTKGPLRVSSRNPRYLADRAGRAVYLTGSHTWSNLQDMGTSDPPKPFDFDRYLGFLIERHHNFIRGWRWEQSRWKDESGQMNYCAPQPWQRSGPGMAQDGKPRFDLTRADQAYYDRMRKRVVAARTRGIYLSIMLFEGWGMQFAGGAWQYHPFNPANNVNGVGVRSDDRAAGLAIYTLTDPRVTALQEAYVREVIDTVHDLDNVLYEISNENHKGSTDWQYHMIRFVKQVEANKRYQHPVGMTFQYEGGSNSDLFAGPADWISPNPQGGYRDDPPPADGRKVVLSDTDHLWGEGGSSQWVWKSFTRGMNPLFMDRVAQITGNPQADIADAESIRGAMGRTRLLADRLDMNVMLPAPALASSGYCLADPGRDYVVYVPAGGAVTVDLTAASGGLSVEWIRPVDGGAADGQGANGGSRQTLSAPFGGDAVVRIWKRQTGGRPK